MVMTAMASEPSSLTPLHPFWDRAIRFLLGRPERLRDILSLYDRELAARLDFQRLEPLDRSFILDDYREREVDLAVRLPYRSAAGSQTSPGSAESEVIVYLLLEHQSTVDPWMPFRLLFYMLRIWDHQRIEIQAQGGPARLAPIIPVVFYTGGRKWKAPRDFRKLIDGPPELLRFGPRFDILYQGLRQTPVAALESIGPVGWALRAVQRVEADHPEFAAVLERAGRAINALLGDEWRELAQFLLLLIDHQRPQEEQAALQDVLRQAIDRRRQREFSEMGKSYADAMIEEGMKRGRQEGRQEGLEEGRRSACRSIILRQGRHRFGEPSAAQQARLEAIASESELDALAEAVLGAADWDDLLAGH
jgi:hypothetical protein